jgi:hypothetical protein
MRRRKIVNLKKIAVTAVIVTLSLGISYNLARVVWGYHMKAVKAADVKGLKFLTGGRSPYTLFTHTTVRRDNKMYETARLFTCGHPRPHWLKI